MIANKLILQLVGGTIIGLGLLFGVHRIYKNFVNHHQEIGYQLCQAEHKEAADNVEDLSEDLANKQEDRVEEEKAEQRDEDTVTRELFEQLKEEKEDDARTFERLLDKAMAASPGPSGVNCANVDMPIELQRIVKSSDSNGG